MATGASSGEPGSAPGERATQARPGSLATALLARLRAVELDEALIITSLLTLCLVVRLLWLRPVEVYWDAAAKWHFARQWSYANDFSHETWSHHMARLGVNVPAYLVQRLLGTATRSFHVLPLAMFALQTLFVYLTCRRLSGRAAAVLGHELACARPLGLRCDRNRARLRGAERR